MDTIKLSTIKANKNNPRTMTRAKLERLMDSISNFKKMMYLRPIVVDETNTVLGGNQRLLALKALKYKEIPKEWIKQAENLTEKEKRQFIIADNVNFGDWDNEILREWDNVELNQFGFDLNNLVYELSEEPPKKEKKEKSEKTPIECPCCGAMLDIQ